MRDSYGSISTGVPSLLLVLFIALKLCGVTDWPWLWVLSPFWIPLTFAIGVLIGYLAFGRHFGWWK